MAKDLWILFLFTCPCCNPPLKTVWWCLYVMLRLLSYRWFMAVLTHLGKQQTRYWDLLRLEHGMRPYGSINTSWQTTNKILRFTKARAWHASFCTSFSTVCRTSWSKKVGEQMKHDPSSSLQAYLQLHFLFSWQNWHFTAYLWADQPVPDSQVVLLHDKFPPVNGTESEEMSWWKLEIDCEAKPSNKITSLDDRAW